MKKRLLLISLMLLIFLCIGGCKPTEKGIEKTENPPVSENINDEQTVAPEIKDESISEKTEEPVKKDEEAVEQNTTDTYSYIAEDGIEITGELGSSEFAIYTLDGENYGILGIDGEEIVEPEFNLIGWCPWHEVVYAEPFPEGREPIVISDKYKIDVHYGHGGVGKSFYIYDVKSEKMYLSSADIEVFYLQQVSTVPVDTPYICYNGDTPLYEGELYPGDESAQLYYKVESLAFTSAEYEYMTSRGSIVKLGECEIADGFVNDYMLIKKDGKSGFVDYSGNAACDFVYADALDAFDGKAWVKTDDGIWKVLSLK